MKNYTKGEWKVGPLSHKNAQIIVADGALVADCFDNEANAHLIAASPRMEQALTTIIDHFRLVKGLGVVDMEVLNIGSRALAKATD